MTKQDEVIATQAATIEALNIKLSDVKSSTDELIKAFTKVSERYKYRGELIQLYEDMDVEKDRTIEKMIDTYVESVDRVVK
jgi:hypothetical protein